MGAGRKTKTILVQERAERERTVNCSVSAKNLRRRELGAVIFGCTHSTIKECKDKNLFGLPSGHISYVKNVTPGFILFLFNYSDRKLHGVFEATSTGQLNINPYAWTGGRTQLTSYPAQVQVRTKRHCRPLIEEEFAPIIAENYYEANHFWFELDRTQTSNLIDLFLSSSLPIPRFSHRSPNPAPEGRYHSTVTIPDTWESVDHGVKSSFSKVEAYTPDEVDEEWEAWEETAADTKQESECSYASVLDGTTNSVPEKSWSSLFKASSASESIPRLEIPKPQTSRFVPLSYPSNVKHETSCLPSSLHKEDEEYGSFADQWRTETSEMPTRVESGFLKLKASASDHVGDPNSEGEVPCVPQVPPLQVSKDNDAGDISSDLGMLLKDSRAQAFNPQSVIYQLMLEFKELKASQLKQKIKISSLEFELACSRIETQMLGEQLKMLIARPTSSSSGVLVLLLAGHALLTFDPPRVECSELPETGAARLEDGMRQDAHIAGRAGSQHFALGINDVMDPAMEKGARKVVLEIEAAQKKNEDIRPILEKYADRDRKGKTSAGKGTASDFPSHPDGTSRGLPATPGLWETSGIPWIDLQLPDPHHDPTTFPLYAAVGGALADPNVDRGRGRLSGLEGQLEEALQTFRASELHEARKAVLEAKAENDRLDKLWRDTEAYWEDHLKNSIQLEMLANNRFRTFEAKIRKRKKDEGLAKPDPEDFIPRNYFESMLVHLRKAYALVAVKWDRSSDKIKALRAYAGQLRTGL
ncbi:OLC1v1001410C1 [Oldenlandia corymbosa var. corymbosa]|uniref:OLC1v1001410C1 n=1 Tax=Oldenlandia corymbosa var. corymbosa TaxID=529605 RepID=A0AAV1D540_OLDCO|nr:OLC1v1001410C1 [Oldenlandia corymbosa var. corymbosa]